MTLPTTFLCVLGGEEVAKELAVAASATDMPHELRRQMYNEAHAFKHSPLFTQKVASGSRFAV